MLGISKTLDVCMSVYTSNPLRLVLESQLISGHQFAFDIVFICQKAYTSENVQILQLPSTQQFLVNRM